MKNIIIFGTGMLSEVLFFYLNKKEDINIAAFTIDKNFIKEENFFGIPVIPFEMIMDYYNPDDYYFLVAVGYAGLNSVRDEKFLTLKQYGFKPFKYVSDNTHIASNVYIPDGCIIFDGTVIHPFSKIKENTIIWSNVYIGHHSCIGRSCFIGSGAIINGAVTLGDYSLVGSNACIREYVKVGDRCIIGAGSVLLKNIQDDSVCSVGESNIVEGDSKKIKLWPPRVSRP